MGIRLSILRACKNIVTPWARFLLHQGISYKEFDDVVRAVFVEIATVDFGIRGRPTNASRVAVLTGLTRKQIKKIRDSIDGTPVEETAIPNQASQVLAAWHSDPVFVDEEGAARVLPFDGHEVSFETLVKKYGKDIPPRAMLRELKRTKSVREAEDGSVVALSRVNVYGGSLTESTIQLMGHSAKCFLETSVHNLMRDPETDIGKFERRSYAAGLSKSDLEEYRTFVRDKGTVFIEEMEQWLDERGYTSKYAAGPADQPRTGVGAYFFTETDEP